MPAKAKGRTPVKASARSARSVPEAGTTTRPPREAGTTTRPAREAGTAKTKVADRAGVTAKAKARRAGPDAKPDVARGGVAKAGAGKKSAVAKAPQARQKVTDKFLIEQHGLLMAERATATEQAEALKAEADSLAQDMEPGDVQFDEESGEGGTVTVDRERDLALSAQARAAVEEVDHALAKVEAGTYGICEGCGQPIPRARLKALPQARLCVTCKSGGLSRR